MNDDNKKSLREVSMSNRRPAYANEGCATGDQLESETCYYCDEPVNLKGTSVDWTEGGRLVYAHFRCSVKNDPGFGDVFTSYADLVGNQGSAVSDDQQELRDQFWELFGALLPHGHPMCDRAAIPDDVQASLEATVTQISRLAIAYKLKSLTLETFLEYVYRVGMKGARVAMLYLPDGEELDPDVLQRNLERGLNAYLGQFGYKAGLSIGVLGEG